MGSERYEAQERLIGPDGQRRLAESRVLIVGVGGLGCASSAYLAMAGVGKLRLVDGDSVALSNLGRQILFTEADLGRPKAEAAAERLRVMNPGAEFEPINAFVDRSNLADLLAHVELVIDGTDNLGARRLLNRAVVTQQIPVVFGAATGWNATLFSATPGGPCYDCLWTEPPESSCETAGILGPLAGTLGAAQATEALRILLHQGTQGRLLLLNALEPEWRTVRIQRKETCATCGTTL